MRRRYGNAQPRRERSGDEAYGAAKATTGEWGTLSGWSAFGEWPGKAKLEPNAWTSSDPDKNKEEWLATRRCLSAPYGGFCG